MDKKKSQYKYYFQTKYLKTVKLPTFKHCGTMFKGWNKDKINTK